MLIVFGSINTDLILNVPHHPAPGETLLAESYMLSGGGKGANQALAAARAGAKTALVGCIGDDSMGRQALSHLKKNGVMTSGVSRTNSPTGLASIAVDPAAQNTIIVAAGANEDVKHDQIPDDILTSRNLLLAQNELPATELATLFKRAQDKPIDVLFNFAPFSPESLGLLKYIDTLILNETEALQAAAHHNADASTQNISGVAESLSAKDDINVIITLGDKGSVAATQDGDKIHVPALKPDNIVDTTGAGDAYCGTFAAALHANMSFIKSMRLAAVAGSLACTKKGAQPSFAYLGEIEEALKDLPDT